MTENSISTLALALCFAPGVLHSVEVAYPLLARWIANYFHFLDLVCPKAAVRT